MKKTLVLAALGLAFAFGLSPAHAQSFFQVKDWDVYVDLPTGFAYVKTPVGWKFVRQLDEEQMSRLPDTTLTALLPPEQQEIHYAHPAMELSPRMMAVRANERLLASASQVQVQQ